MGCCRDFAERFVMLISTLMLIFSLVVLGFGAFLAAQLGDEFNELNLNSPIVVTVVFGAMLLVFSLIGLVGACKSWKIFLFIYLLGCMALSVGVIASGAILLSQTGVLDNVRNGQNVAEDLESAILHFELAVFHVCCEKDDAAALVCDPNNPADTLCIANQDLFDDFEQFLEGPDATTCQLVEAFNLDDQCEDKVAFIEEISDLIEENIVTLGTANIVSGIIMFLLLVCTCVLLWTSRDEKRRN